MESGHLTEWIASEFNPDKFPLIPDDPIEHAGFVADLAAELACLPIDVLEKAVVIFPGLIREDFPTNEIVKAISKVYKPLPPDITAILLGELAVDFLILDEKWAECIPWLDSILALGLETGLPEELSIIYNYRGVCYYRMAKYPEAQRDLEESLKLADEIDNDRRRARARINLGLVFKETGRLEDAAGHYKEALKLAREIGDERTELACYLNIGNIYKELKRWEDGRRAFERGIELASALGDAREAVRGKLNLGVLLLDEGADLDKAAGLFRNVIDAAGSIGAAQLASIAKSNLADVLIRLGRARESLEYSIVSLQEAEKEQDPEGTWRARASLARAYRQLDDADKSEEYFISALSDFDALRRVQLSDRERSEIQRNLRTLQSEFIEFSLEFRGSEIAFARLARSKSRSLQQARVNETEDSNNGVLSDAELLSTIQDVLSGRPGTVILDYFLGSDRLVIFVCNHKEVHACEVPVSIDELADVIEGFTKDINLFIASEEYREAEWGKDVSPPKAMVELGCILLNPVAHLILDSEHLIIVPQGTINHVPFHALVDSEGRYLVETHSVSILPSSDFLIHSKEPDKLKPETMLLIQGTDAGLDGSGREIAELRDIFSDGLLVVGSESQDGGSSLAVVNSMMGEVDVIHFTGHAEFDRKDPYSSALIMDNDERLRVIDLMESGIYLGNTQLVTLSACETGMAKVLTGDEVIGIARAFLAAGVQAVMMSLWAVSDSATAKLMPEFYNEWLSGKSPPEALRHAILHLLDSNRMHPYFFAPFNIIGKYS